MRRLFFSFLVLAALPNLGQTQPAASKEWEFTLGLGAGFEADYEGSNDYEPMVLPIVEINWRDRVTLGSTSLADAPGLTVIPLKGEFLGEEWWMGAALGYEDGRKEGDNPILRGLGDMNVGAVGALAVGYEIGPVDFALAWLQDIGGDRKGSRVTFGAEVDFNLTPRVEISFGPNITWASRNYMQNSFGLSDAQVARSRQQTRFNLRRHDAGAGVKDVGIEAGLTWTITQRWRFHAMAEYNHLLGDAAASPLVKDHGAPGQFFGGLGFSYRW